MNEFYTEQLIKQHRTVSISVKKIGLILATLLAVGLAFWLPVTWPVPIMMVVVDVFLFKRMGVEYEYVYYNGDLDIDRIKGKMVRKRVLEINVKDVEILAPSNSIELQPYKQLKTYDYSSNSGSFTYEMVIAQAGKKFKVIFEPNATVLEGMKFLAPRNIYI